LVEPEVRFRGEFPGFRIDGRFMDSLNFRTVFFAAFSALFCLCAGCSRSAPQTAVSEAVPQVEGKWCQAPFFWIKIYRKRASDSCS
jgi:hypothetical protein